MTKAGRYTLTEEQGARVLRVLRELLEQRGGNVSKLARDLELSQPSTWRLLNEKARAGLPTAERVAKLADVSVSAILGHAPPDAREASPVSHPHLFEALGLLGKRAHHAAREGVTAAAAYLPDMATSTWLAMLADPAHETSSSVLGGAPSSREPPTETRELAVVKKKPA